jgi:hypothetical protein
MKRVIESNREAISVSIQLAHPILKIGLTSIDYGYRRMPAVPLGKAVSEIVPQAARSHF